MQYHVLLDGAAGPDVECEEPPTARWNRRGPWGRQDACVRNPRRWATAPPLLTRRASTMTKAAAT